MERFLEVLGTVLILSIYLAITAAAAYLLIIGKREKEINDAEIGKNNADLMMSRVDTGAKNHE